MESKQNSRRFVFWGVVSGEKKIVVGVDFLEGMIGVIDECVV